MANSNTNKISYVYVIKHANTKGVYFHKTTLFTNSQNASVYKTARGATKAARTLARMGHDVRIEERVN